MLKYKMIVLLHYYIIYLINKMNIVKVREVGQFTYDVNVNLKNRRMATKTLQILCNINKGAITKIACLKINICSYINSYEENVIQKDIIYKRNIIPRDKLNKIKGNVFKL